MNNVLSGRTKKRRLSGDPMNPTQPLQPLIKQDGILRFKANTIIVWLFESGRLNLNDIAILPFPAEDHEQLAQLLGYSVSGFEELSYVTEATYAAVEAAAEAIR